MEKTLCLKSRKSSIKTGFFYFFGAVQNPFQHEVDAILNRTNQEALEGDWQKVGGDVRKVFVRETEKMNG